MKGICFKEPLFHATVEGWKTQTRRIVEPQPDTIRHFASNDGPYKDGRGNSYLVADNKIIKPRYKIGDVVYLKEPYYPCDNIEGLYYDLYKFVGHKLPYDNIKWQNKLFMPAAVARYFIKITAVSAERLQYISEEDCLKEGIQAFTKDDRIWKYGLDGWGWADMPRTPCEAYAALIDKINGKGTWNSNPFVWVYDYILTDKP